MLLKILKTFFVLFLCASCTTLKLSSREKIYGVIALASTGGAFYGATRPEAKGKNALLFGAGAGLLASLISLAVFNEEKKVSELQEKLIKLEEDLGLMYEGSKIKYLTGGKNYLTKKRYPKGDKTFYLFWGMAPF